MIWQSNNASITGTPEIGASGAPMTSGTYSFDPDLVSDRKWPAYFDSKAIWADWNNSRLFTVQLSEDGSNYTDINRFLPTLPMRRPHALQFGPDGALYMIEWGSGFGGNNSDSGVYRIDYVSGNRAPIASASADVTSGPAPLTVQFDSTGSRDPDGETITYEWDFGDGSPVSTEESPSHTYTEEGNFTARLTVTDPGGRTAVSNIDIVVGNTAPTVKLTVPLNGGFFEFGDTLRYEVEVTDPEDGEDIDCDRVVVQPALGHDEHSHGYEQYTGCSGQFPLPGDEGHTGANIFGTVTATYTDGGAGEIAALTGSDTIVVHTKRKEAEFFDKTGRTGPVTGGTPGVQVETTTDAGGGQNIGFIEVGDWFAWDVMNLSGIDQITLRGASQPAGGGTWEARQGSPDGPTVATFVVPSTGGWQTWQSFTSDVTGASEDSEPLYFVATAGAANVNWLDFVGIGVTENRPPTLTVSSDVTSGPGPLTVAFTSTVSDPDGDTPIEIEWEFGDGSPVSTEANPTHVYQNPGTYEVRATATDSRGASRTRSLEIRVTAPDEETCFTGRSDGFDGTELDTQRWDSVVRGDQTMTVSGGTLNIPLTQTDLYQNTNNAPNIVLQHLPGGPFEVTTKVTAPINRQWQQAGLIMYGDDDNYVKLVVGGRTAEPNKANNIIQWSKELAGAVTENNGPALGADFPDTVWLRLSSSNGLNLTASYSADGVEFIPITTGTQHNLAGINEPRVGLTAFANSALGAGITAAFDYFHITPDDTAVPCEEVPDNCFSGRSDDFLGTDLNVERWNRIVRPSGNVTVADSHLTIPMTATDLYQTTNTAPDLILQDLPAGPFEVTTKVTAPIVRQYQQGGLLIYGNDDNYMKLMIQGRSAQPNKASNIVQFARETAGTAVETNTLGLGADFPDTVWLRMVSSDGVAVEAYYSADGEEWTRVGNSTYSTAGLNNPKVGLWAAGVQELGAGIDARFDYFRITPDDTAEPCEEEPEDETAPVTTITLTPAEADGEAGWYVSAPSFTLAATDGDGSGVASTEYRIGDGPWTDYPGEAVELDGQGDLTVTYRSTDEAGNVEEPGNSTVKVDTVAPAVEATVTGDYEGEMKPLDGSTLGGTATMSSQVDDGVGSTTATLSLTGLQQDTNYESHLHVGTCDTLGLHYMDDPAGPGTPPNELWPTNPGWTSGPRIVADAQGESVAEATVAWAPRTDGRALVLHREGAIVGCATLDLTGPGTVHLDATDAHSGVDSLEYRIGGGDWTGYEDPFVVDQVGSNTVDWRVADVAGNTDDGSFDVEVPEAGGTGDAPVVTVGTTPASPSGKNGWYTGPVTLTASATGGTGELTIERRVNNGGWTEHTGPFVLSADGTHQVQLRATDAEGTQSEIVTTTVKIDSTAPTARVLNLREGQSFRVHATREVRVATSDAGSGVEVRRVLLNGKQVSTPVLIDAVKLLTGTHEIRVVVVDRAGNRTVTKVSFTVKADYKGAKRLAKRLVREDRLPAAAGKRMRQLVQQAAKADRAGRTAAARNLLDQVAAQARFAKDRVAKAAVRDVALQLKRQL
ncbi:PKD domain-containing protein [Nocardioides sp.]|uniref:OmpL47-type beta-barrel domain-containing protein n=1 Tax=Nocardioides sp. TaxID=35761 RepID=UPI002735AFFA|nr:PKD domain-containing protein [Nocardioides sp.]MDP3890535.1 PKD domain-containing protein [Nocardioides sp.]